MKHVWWYISIVVIDTLSAWFVYILFPNYRVYLLQEDGLVENLSAFFFLITFFVAFSLAIKKKGKNRALFLISAIGLLGFLDEVSYGERLFGLSMPEIEGEPIDALHDFYEVGYFQLFKIIPTYAITLYLLLTSIAVGLLILLFIHKAKVWRELSMTQRYPLYILMLLIVFLLVSALVIDFLGSSSVRGYRVPALSHGTLLEEMLEMNVGIGLLFCSLSLYFSGSSQKQTKKTVVTAVVKIADRLSLSQRWMGVAGAGVVLLVLGILTWHKGWLYEDTETLWRDNVAKSPGSWAFHYVQGNVLSESGELEEAIRHYRQALKLSPGNAAIYFDLGNALSKQENLDEAVDHFRQALRIQPEFAEAHQSLGEALAQQGKRDEAIKHYEEALRIMKSRSEASAER